MKSILGSTKVVGLLGWPVEHSLSPAMQGAAFEAAGLDWVYVALPVRPSEVGEAIRGLRALGFAGANVTIPHKQSVLRYLDSLDPAAKLIGAVNTIRIEPDGRLRGFNTDSDGAYETLRQDSGFEVAGRRVAIVGAGGAARALAFGAAIRKARSIAILNREEEKEQAFSLSGDLSAAFPGIEVWGLSLSTPSARTRVEDADFVAQATPMGMKPADPLPIPLEWISSGALVFDAIYTPEQTAFLEGCERERGCRTASGLGMLLRQGAQAFRIWTGQEPDIQSMKQALRKALRHP